MRRPHTALRRLAAASPLSAARPASAVALASFLHFGLRHITMRSDVRNIAVIAHVDHGKTTLIDSMLTQSGTMAGAVGHRVMDSGAQEKERGITILAKNTAIVLDGNRRINIVDTPGHLDFSGEVERALQMVEGFILLVDAAEGVKPGTRYVLRKALKLNLKPIIVINKIDKDASKIEKTEEDLQDLFLETATDDSQLELVFMYGSGRSGYVNDEVKEGGTLTPLFEKIFTTIPAPKQATDDAPFQMLVAQVNEETGGGASAKRKIAVGRVFRGSVKKDDIVTVTLQGKEVNTMVKEVRIYKGVDQTVVDRCEFGDLVSLTLMEPPDHKIPLEIGATLCARDAVEAWPYEAPDAPTFSLVVQEMKAAWKEKEATPELSRIRAVKDRIRREVMVNTALKVDYLEDNTIRMMGRGPLHLSVIIEEMRREGFEFELRAPSVLKKVVDGVLHEPFEKLVLEFSDKLSGEVVSMLSQRLGELGEMTNVTGDRLLVECVMPVRFMLDVPVAFNRLTGGDGVLNHSFDSYREEISINTEREAGALIQLEDGTAQTYSLEGHSQHGRFFIGHGDQLFKGQIVGENSKTRFQDMPVNVTRKNQQQGGFRKNVVDSAKNQGRSFQSSVMTLEDAIAWVTPYELVTVTPQSIRIRKPDFTGKTSMRHGKK
jgi:GTP-binding protein TypA/BipA